MMLKIMSWVIAVSMLCTSTVLEGLHTVSDCMLSMLLLNVASAESIESEFSYVVYNAEDDVTKQYVRITGYKGTSNIVYVPDYINGLEVTSISFNNASSVSSQSY